MRERTLVHNITDTSTRKNNIKEQNNNYSPESLITG
jgi:hypothetical protein